MRGATDAAGRGGGRWALPLLAAALLLTAQQGAHAKKKPRKRPPAAPDVSVVFTEPGSLGLDFSMDKLPGGKLGLSIKGISEGTHAASFPALKVGMRLLSVDDESGGVVVHTEVKASSPKVKNHGLHTENDGFRTQKGWISH